MVEFGNVGISAEGRTVADCLDDGLDFTRHSKAKSSSHDQAMDMRREDVRLRTFRHWPSDWASALARLGFISVSADSECLVQCAFCGQTIADFSSPDQASLMHWQKAREVCRYLQGEDVGNVPLPQQVPSTSHSSLTSQTVPLTRPVEHTRLVQAGAGTTPNESGSHHCRPEQSRILQPLAKLSFTEPNPGTTRSHPASRPRLDSESASYAQRRARHQGGEAVSTKTVHWRELVRTARYPDMANFQDRLKTLSRWPLVKPSPTELARAGFFHVKCPSTGQQSPRECWRDSVQCFWCGERIHRWQQSDDAVVEHARLSPRCVFVLQVLGHQVCDDIAKNVTAATAAASEAPVCHQGPHNQQQRNHLQHHEHQHHHHHQHHEHQHHQRQHVSGDRRSREELDDLMRSTPVQTVLQMGFPPQLIRSILSRNSQLLSADTLCSLALQAAEKSSRVFSTSPETNSPTAGQGPLLFLSSPSPLTPSLLPSSSSPPHHHNNTQQYGGGEELEYLKSLQLPGERDTNSHTPAGESRRQEEEEVRRGEGERGRVLMCKVCSEAEVRVVFRPCNHLVCCSRCMALFTSCPQCHQIIQGISTVCVTS